MRLGVYFLLIFTVLIVSVSEFGQTDSSSKSGYHLLKKIEVGGGGGWDYLFADSDAHRLYVSHATKVVVIDTDKDAVIGEIPNTNGVHGIAVAEEFGRGFVSAGRD